MRGAPDDFVTAAAYRDDREAIRDWLTRSLLKQGVWGSGLDSTLRDIRGAIRSDGQNGFPVQAIEAAMRRRGKILTFDAEEIDDLLDTKYGTARAFMLLALLYPGIDVRDPFHMDHLFPQAWFTPYRRALGRSRPSRQPATHPGHGQHTEARPLTARLVRGRVPGCRRSTRSVGRQLRG
jgi:hypothetical protein